MAECFWTNKVGVQEDCGGGSNPPDIPPGHYIYVLWGGLFESYTEVRKYNADGSTPDGVRVAGSGISSTDPSSLYRPNSLAVRLESDGFVHMFVGDYSHAVEWVEGELERRATFSGPGGYRITAPAFNEIGALVMGISNFTSGSTPSNPPFILSNYVIDAAGSSVGIGDGYFAQNQVDLDSMYGVSSLVFEPDGTAWARDSSNTNQAPNYRGRLLRWTKPYGVAELMSTTIGPGDANEVRELNGQIAYFEGGTGPGIVYVDYSQRYYEDDDYDMYLSIRMFDPTTLSDQELYMFGAVTSFPPTSPFLGISGLQAAHYDDTLYVFAMAQILDPSGFAGDYQLIRIPIDGGTGYEVIGNKPPGGRLAGHIAHLEIPELPS